MISILFMGRKRVAAQCLQWLLDVEGVEVVGVLTDSHLGRSVTRDVAERANLPIFSYEEAEAALDSGALRSDLGVSMLYWRKFRGSFLSALPLGVINFHPAPLPEYKGVGGYNLAILDGLDHWATSAHYVDQSIDTGEIIEVASFPIDTERETAQSLERTSQVRLEDLFKRVVARQIETNEKLPTTPNGPGRYLSRAELEAMKRIDPEHDDIARKVRAFWFPPYDGAYIEFQGQKFTLTDRSILEGLADPDASSLFSTPSTGKPGDQA